MFSESSLSLISKFSMLDVKINIVIKKKKDHDIQKISLGTWVVEEFYREQNFK